MKRSLIALEAGTFALGMAEFGMMGILGVVSKSIGVNIVEAGHLICAASLGGAVISMGLGIASPALAGAPLALIGAIMLYVLHRKTGV